MTYRDTHDQIRSLTEREKQSLRLLITGHDAKSTARHLGLSVHTVNERLRDARRKLHVSSSREAARLLVQCENGDPEFVGDKLLGVVMGPGSSANAEHSRKRLNAGSPLVWLGGAIIIMTIVATALAITSVLMASGLTQTHFPGVAVASLQDVSDTAETKTARGWLELLDAQRWDDTWRAAGSAFKSMPIASWASTGKSVRDPLGPVKTRILQTITNTTSLPGAPAGEYQVIQFRTNFAQKKDAIETVVLSREQLSWKVNGYFIR